MAERHIPPEGIEADLAGYDVVITACRPASWAVNPPPGLARWVTERPPNSQERTCRRCGVTVFITPRQLALSERVVIDILCFPCTFRVTKGADVDSIPMYRSFDEARDER